MTSISKTFDTYLLLDWKKMTVKVKKRLPNKKSIGAFEIPAHLVIKANVPDFAMIEVKGEIDIPESKVKEMTVHSI